MIPTRREFRTTVAVTAGVSFTASPRASLEAAAARPGPPPDRRRSRRRSRARSAYSCGACGSTGRRTSRARSRRFTGWASARSRARGLWGKTAGELRGALDAAGLRCQSAHRTSPGWTATRRTAFAEAKGARRRLGGVSVGRSRQPWTRDDALKAAAAFNRFGKAAQAADLRFAYHCHGYEFVPSPEGTLFDTLAQQTDPAAVTFQMDVFHALLGGTDPVALIARYGSRVSSLHLKDLKKGFPVKVGTATAPAEADVPLGTGEVDMAEQAACAAIKAGTGLYFVEDESADPLTNIPQSVAYLKTFRNA